jgi:putative aminopeptidase FrvX
MKSLIQTLVETSGPSGFEAEIRKVVRDKIAPFGDEIRVDNLGNLIAVKGSPEPDRKKLMLAAHLDEIGIMATHIDEAGFIRFLPIGGVSPLTCLGSRVKFLNGATGVIGVERLDSGKTPAMSQLYIDTGCQSRKDCAVNVGDVAVFERPFSDLGNRLVSKAMDDRISVAIMIETLRQLSESGAGLAYQVFFVFSVQEEVGTRGATTAAFGLEPDLGLAVDVTATGDTPKGLKMEVSLGHGPAIKVRDQGNISDPRVVEWMVRTAEKARLPYQLEVLEHGRTDARAIQLSRAGVPAGCLSIPCRYIHSPSEMVDFQDVENAVRLLVALLQQPIDLGG